MGKRTGLEAEEDRKMIVGEAGVRVYRGAECHQLES